MRVEQTGRLHAFLGALVLGVTVLPVHGQSVMDHVDLSSPEMTEAEMTRDQVLAMVDAFGPGVVVDLKERRLSGLDLSGINLERADLRWARLNRTDLSGANLRGARLDLAWLIGANLQGADLSGASLFSTQMQGCALQNAVLDGARIVANLTDADLSHARLVKADMAADMKNQSMGLMRTVLRSADAKGANFQGANLARVDAEFASFRNARLTDADFTKARLAGADLTGASVSGLILSGADVNSARLLELERGQEIVGLDTAKNLKEAFR